MKDGTDADILSRLANAGLDLGWQCEFCTLDQTVSDAGGCNLTFKFLASPSKRCLPLSTMTYRSVGNIYGLYQSVDRHMNISIGRSISSSLILANLESRKLSLNAQDVIEEYM